MNTSFGLEQCFSYITCHLKPPAKPVRSARDTERPPTVTISRQTGAGAHTITAKLAAYLQANGPKDKVPWTVFDRELVGKVLEEHNLPKELARFMPEDRVSAMTTCSKIPDCIPTVRPSCQTTKRSSTY